MEMTNPGTLMDIDDVLMDPSRYFSHPTEVLDDARLTRDEKRRILRSWALDAELIDQAESENMRGRAGDRFADRMRRGTALVFGDVGDFLASRLVAGTIAIGGRAGAHVGYGMRRGSVVFAGVAPLIAPTFVPALADAPVAWQLLARDLARHGGPFAGLPARRIVRRAPD